jgi:uncharacterized protein YutE (UPF0331/DUF86 family)
MLTEPDDVSYNKAAIIERSLRRVKEEYSFDPELKNFTHIDALILNLERACQAAIDLAMHLTAVHHLGMPQNSGDSFRLLFRSGMITESTAKAMASMTGFRNIAVHEYQTLDMSVVHYISNEGYKSLIEFCSEIGIRIAV